MLPLLKRTDYRMKNIYRLISIAATAAAVFCVILSTAHASLMLRQPSVKLFLRQGQVFSGGIILENVSDKPLEVNAGFADALDKNGKPIKHACSSWISLSDEKFVIPPKSIKDLRFTVSVPKDARGGFWTGLVYSYRYGTVKGPDDITLNVKMHLEEPIEITVSDTIEKRFAIEKLEAVQLSGSVEVSAALKNTGNTFVQVTPRFIIANSEGKVIKNIRSGSFKSYPGGEYDMKGREKLERGRYSVIAIVDYEADEPVIEQRYFEIK